MTPKTLKKKKPHSISGVRITLVSNKHRSFPSLELSFFFFSMQKEEN